MLLRTLVPELQAVVNELTWGPYESSMCFNS